MVVYTFLKYDHVIPALGTENRVLYTQGRCDRMKGLELILRLWSNSSGTLLLLATIHTAVFLTAPTRNEVNQFHSKKVWLDIGRLSLRNFKAAGALRKGATVLMMVSSLILPFLYNASFFTTLVAHDYTASIVTQWSLPQHWDFKHPSTQTYPDTLAPDIIQQLQANDHWHFLPPAECIAAYDTDFQFNRRHVIAITTDRTIPQTDSVVWRFHKHHMTGLRDHSWLCGQKWEMQAEWSDCTLGLNTNDLQVGPENERNESDWMQRPVSRKFKIDYCLSEWMGDECGLEYNRPIYAVLGLTLLAIALVTSTTFVLYNPKDCLISPGDAIASYLKFPDETTTGQCTHSKKDYKNWLSAKDGIDTEPRKLEEEQFLYWSVLLRRGRNLFIVLAFLLVTAQVVIGLVLQWNHDSNFLNSGLVSVARRGLGNVNQVSLIDFLNYEGRFLPSLGLEQTVTAAIRSRIYLAYGIPMVLCFSLMFLLYHNLLHEMLFAQEYHSYYAVRKPLRITSSLPRGKQTVDGFVLTNGNHRRLWILGTLYGFFLSQSSFLWNVVVRKEDGSSEVQLTVGWSTIAIIGAFTCAGCAFLVLGKLGSRKIPGKMPVAGACSAAISAACHDLSQMENPEELEVMWGVQKQEGEARRLLHLGFSAGEVGKPDKAYQRTEHTWREVIRYM